MLLSFFRFGLLQHLSDYNKRDIDTFKIDLSSWNQSQRRFQACFPEIFLTVHCHTDIPSWNWTMRDLQRQNLSPQSPGEHFLIPRILRVSIVRIELSYARARANTHTHTHTHTDVWTRCHTVPNVTKWEKGLRLH